MKPKPEYVEEKWAKIKQELGWPFTAVEFAVIEVIYKHGFIDGQTFELEKQKEELEKLMGKE